LARRQTDLRPLTAGILGMTFKAESDDARDSLSFKLRKLLTLECKRVLCHDPYWAGPGLVPLEELVAEADVYFVATPHKVYRTLSLPPGRLVIDVWNALPADAGDSPPVAEVSGERKQGRPMEILVAT
jgi:UDP-N-acetyl-D-mannosaminuronic acid dehydrogenase